jgi:hypothetical protein
MIEHGNNLTDLQEPRHTISYFDHERNAAVDFPRDLEEIQEFGFNSVVFCLSEDTLKDPDRLPVVRQAIRCAKEESLQVLVDPWSIGKVFGGEGGSDFARAGKFACFCNPEFDILLRSWVDTVADTDADGVFWDEPEAMCQKHNEVALVDHFSAQSTEQGLGNWVCLPADRRKAPLLEEFAALPQIKSVGVDPYWKNVFEDIPEDKRTIYVADWVTFVNNAAGKYKKETLCWIQGFDIRKGDTGMIKEFAQIMRENGGENIGFWGYRACASYREHFYNPQIYATPEEIWEAAKPVFTLDNRI